jgi:hypothetical protein
MEPLARFDNSATLDGKHRYQSLGADATYTGGDFQLPPVIQKVHDRNVSVSAQGQTASMVFDAQEPGGYYRHHAYHIIH